jgi:hypothetical protein
LAFGILRLAGHPAGASALNECPVPQPQTVSVDISRGDVRTDEISLQELQEAAAAIHRAGPVVGAFEPDIKYAALVDNRTREVATGWFCIDPDHVILTVTITRTIHIPKEFATDACLLALAREHEQKHVEAGDTAMAPMQPKLLDALKSALRRPSVPQPSRREAVAVLLKGIQAEIVQSIDQIVAEHKRLSATINSPEEYNRLATSCGGRALY